MKRTFLTLALAIIIQAANAETPVLDCQSIYEDGDRLKCYDNAFGQPSFEKPSEKSRNNAWIVKAETSAFKDTTDVYLRLLSTEAVQCRRHGAPDYLWLHVRCMENTTAVFVTGDCHFADHGGYDRVDFRLDSDPSRQHRMTDSTDNAAIGLWRGRSSIPVIKAMLEKDILLARLRPFGMSPITAEFRISGLADVIKPLRESCGW